jgi:hypothetical protein
VRVGDGEMGVKAGGVWGHVTAGEGDHGDLDC